MEDRWGVEGLDFDDVGDVRRPDRVDAGEIRRDVGSSEDDPDRFDGEEDDGEIEGRWSARGFRSPPVRSPPLSDPRPGYRLRCPFDDGCDYVISERNAVLKPDETRGVGYSSSPRPSEDCVRDATAAAAAGEIGQPLNETPGVGYDSSSDSSDIGGGTAAIGGVGKPLDETLGVGYGSSPGSSEAFGGTGAEWRPGQPLDETLGVGYGFSPGSSEAGFGVEALAAGRLGQPVDETLGVGYGSVGSLSSSFPRGGGLIVEGDNTGLSLDEFLSMRLPSESASDQVATAAVADVAVTNGSIACPSPVSSPLPKFGGAKCSWAGNGRNVDEPLLDYLHGGKGVDAGRSGNRYGDSDGDADTGRYSEEDSFDRELSGIVGWRPSPVKGTRSPPHELLRCADATTTTQYAARISSGNGGSVGSGNRNLVSDADDAFGELEEENDAEEARAGGLPGGVDEKSEASESRSGGGGSVRIVPDPTSSVATGEEDDPDHGVDALGAPDCMIDFDLGWESDGCSATREEDTGDPADDARRLILSCGNSVEDQSWAVEGEVRAEGCDENAFGSREVVSFAPTIGVQDFLRDLSWAEGQNVAEEKGKTSETATAKTRRPLRVDPLPPTPVAGGAGGSDVTSPTAPMSLAPSSSLLETLADDSSGHDSGGCEIVVGEPRAVQCGSSNESDPGDDCKYSDGEDSSFEQELRCILQRVVGTPLDAGERRKDASSNGPDLGPGDSHRLHNRDAGEEGKGRCWVAPNFDSAILDSGIRDFSCRQRTIESGSVARESVGDNDGDNGTRGGDQGMEGGNGGLRKESDDGEGRGKGKGAARDVFHFEELFLSADSGPSFDLDAAQRIEPPTGLEGGDGVGPGPDGGAGGPERRLTVDGPSVSVGDDEGSDGSLLHATHNFPDEDGQISTADQSSRRVVQPFSTIIPQQGNSTTDRVGRSSDLTCVRPFDRGKYDPLEDWSSPEWAGQKEVKHQGTIQKEELQWTAERLGYGLDSTAAEELRMHSELKAPTWKEKCDLKMWEKGSAVQEEEMLHTSERLQGEVERLREELESSRKDRSKLEAQLFASQEESQHFIARENEGAAREDELRHSLEQLRKEGQILMGDLNITRTEKGRMQMELEAHLRAVQEGAQDDILRKEEVEEKLQQDMEQLVETALGWRKELDSMRAEKEQMQSKLEVQLRSAQEHAQDLRAQSEEALGQTVEQLQKELDSLRTEKHSIKSELEAQICVSQDELLDIRAREKESTFQKEELRCTSEQLQREAQKLREDLESTSTEKKRIKMKLCAVQEEAQDDRLQMEEEKEKLQQDMEQLQLDGLGWRKELDSVRAEKEQLQSELEAQLRSAQEDARDLQAQSEEKLGQTVEQLQKELDSLRTEKQFMKSELEAQLCLSRNELRDLIVQEKESTFQKEELCCTSEQLRGEAQKLREDLESTSTEKKRMQMALEAELFAVKKEVEEERASKEEVVEKLQRDMEQLQQDGLGWRKELDSVRVEKEQLQSELEAQLRSAQEDARNLQAKSEEKLGQTVEQLHKELDSIKTEKQLMKSELEAQLCLFQDELRDLRVQEKESSVQKDELLCTSEQLRGEAQRLREDLESTEKKRMQMKLETGKRASKEEVVEKLQRDMEQLQQGRVRWRKELDSARAEKEQSQLEIEAQLRSAQEDARNLQAQSEEKLGQTVEQLHKEMDSIKTEKQFMKSELEAQLHASQEKQANLRAWNEESAAQKDELLCTSEQLGGGAQRLRECTCSALKYELFVAQEEARELREKGVSNSFREAQLLKTVHQPHEEVVGSRKELHSIECQLHTSEEVTEMFKVKTEKGTVQEEESRQTIQQLQGQLPRSEEELKVPRANKESTQFEVDGRPHAAQEKTRVPSVGGKKEVTPEEEQGQVMDNMQKDTVKLKEKEVSLYPNATDEVGAFLEKEILQTAELLRDDALRWREKLDSARNKNHQLEADLHVAQEELQNAGARDRKVVVQGEELWRRVEQLEGKLLISRKELSFLHKYIIHLVNECEMLRDNSAQCKDRYVDRFYSSVENSQICIKHDVSESLKVKSREEADSTKETSEKKSKQPEKKLRTAEDMIKSMKETQVKECINGHDQLQAGKAMEVTCRGGKLQLFHGRRVKLCTEEPWSERKVDLMHAERPGEAEAFWHQQLQEKDFDLAASENECEVMRRKGHELNMQCKTLKKEKSLIQIELSTKKKENAHLQEKIDKFVEALKKQGSNTQPPFLANNDTIQYHEIDKETDLKGKPEVAADIKGASLTKLTTFKTSEQKTKKKMKPHIEGLKSKVREMASFYLTSYTKVDGLQSVVKRQMEEIETLRTEVKKIKGDKDATGKRNGRHFGLLQREREISLHSHDLDLALHRLGTYNSPKNESFSNFQDKSTADGPLNSIDKEVRKTNLGTDLKQAEPSLHGNKHSVVNNEKTRQRDADSSFLGLKQTLLHPQEGDRHPETNLKPVRLIERLQLQLAKHDELFEKESDKKDVPVEVGSMSFGHQNILSDTETNPELYMSCGHINQKEVDGLKGDLVAVDKSKQRCNKQLDYTLAEVKKLKSEIRLKDTQIEQFLLSTPSRARGAIKELIVRIASVEAERNDYFRRIQRMTKKASDLSMNTEHEQKECCKVIKRQKEEMATEIQRLMGVIKIGENETKEVVSELVEELASSESEKSELTERLESVESQLISSNSRCKSLKTQVAGLEASLSTIAVNRDFNSSEANHFKDIIRELVEVIEIQRVQYFDICEELASGKGNKENEQHEIEAWTNGNVPFKSAQLAIEVLEVSVERAQAECTYLKEEPKQAKEMRSVAEIRLEESEAKVKNLELTFLKKEECVKKNELGGNYVATDCMAAQPTTFIPKKDLSAECHKFADELRTTKESRESDYYFQDCLLPHSPTRSEVNPEILPIAMLPCRDENTPPLSDFPLRESILQFHQMVNKADQELGALVKEFDFLCDEDEEMSFDTNTSSISAQQLDWELHSNRKEASDNWDTIQSLQLRCELMESERKYLLHGKYSLSD